MDEFRSSIHLQVSKRCRKNYVLVAHSTHAKKYLMLSTKGETFLEFTENLSQSETVVGFCFCFVLNLGLFSKNYACETHSRCFVTLPVQCLPATGGWFGSFEVLTSIMMNQKFVFSLVIGFHCWSSNVNTEDLWRSIAYFRNGVKIF